MTRTRKRRKSPYLTENGFPWPRVEGPIENDWEVATEFRWNGRIIQPGTELSIRGETGRFRFIKYVKRPNGIEWIDTYGPYDDFRSFRPDRIRRVHWKRKTPKGLLAERQEAKAAA